MKKFLLFLLMTTSALAYPFYMNNVGNYSFGYFGRTPIYMNRMGPYTFGTIGNRPFYSTQVGNFTFGQVGVRQNHLRSNFYKYNHSYIRSFYHGRSYHSKYLGSNMPNA